MEITLINGENAEDFSEVLPGTPGSDQLAVGVIEDGEAAGAIVLSIDGSACTMDHLYILPGYRRKGLATKLFSEVKKTFKEDGFSAVLCYFRNEEGVYGFLKKNGFYIVKGDPLVSVKADVIAGSANAQKLVLAADNKKVISFSEIKGGKKKALQNKLVENRFDPVVASEGYYDESLSFAYTEGDELKGVLLSFAQDNDIYVTAALSFAEGTTVMVSLVSSFLKAVNKIRTADTEIIFLCRNESVLSFAAHLAGRGFNSDEIKESFDAVLEL